MMCESAAKRSAFLGQTVYSEFTIHNPFNRNSSIHLAAPPLKVQ
jgi:hypothetical protein